MMRVVVLIYVISCRVESYTVVHICAWNIMIQQSQSKKKDRNRRPY